MGGRRKTLMLGGTTDVLNPILAFQKPTSTEVSSSLRLSAGRLHVHAGKVSSLQDLLDERGGKETAFDDAAIIRVAAATLRELSLTSGSWDAGKISNTVYAGNKHDSVIVEHGDFMKALGASSPSLSLAELNRYERSHEQFEGRSK